MVTGSSPSGPIYLDTSALVKVYLPEAESSIVDQWLIGRQDLFISDLVVTEIVSAVARRRRDGSLEARVAQLLRSQILKDIESGVFLKLDLVPAVFRDAERILLAVDAVALQAADAIHLALALSAEAHSVLTFDGRMAEAATSLGFEVWGVNRKDV